MSSINYTFHTAYLSTWGFLYGFIMGFFFPLVCFFLREGMFRYYKALIF